jgi:hypothetical protein
MAFSMRLSDVFIGNLPQTTDYLAAALTIT